MSEHPLHELAMAIRMDLTDAQGKLTEMMRQIGELEPVGPQRESFWNGPVLVAGCPECGVAGLKHKNGHPVHAADCSLGSGRITSATRSSSLASSPPSLRKDA